MIAAEGEHKASRALRHAAEVIAECPAALQVTRMIMMTMVVELVMIMMTRMVVVLVMIMMTMVVVLAMIMRHAAEVIAECPAALQVLVMLER